MTRSQRQWLTSGLFFIVLGVLKLTVFGGDRSIGVLWVVGGAMWCVAAVWPWRSIPDRLLPSKDPDDYR